MTSSELNRKLLFRGHREVTDFLRNSPLNRCLYKRFLGVISASAEATMHCNSCSKGVSGGGRVAVVLTGAAGGEAVQ